MLTFMLFRVKSIVYRWGPPGVNIDATVRTFPTTPGRSNRPQREFIASIYFSMRVCVRAVYLGSKSPAAGRVAVCQDLLIGVWGRDYEG